MNKKFWSLNKIKLAIAIKIFFVLLAIGIFNKKGILRAIDLGQQLTNIENNIAYTENENRLLEKAIRSYRSEQFQIEKIAREDLGLAKKNEVIIKIITARM